MTTEQRQSTGKRQSTGSGVARATFGAVLFIAWGVLSVLWVYDAIYELAQNHPIPAITAVVAVLLMLVLAVMEGLEVVMIHDWSRLYPDRSAHDLAAWLSARQMFVAFIVVAATILAQRDVIWLLRRPDRTRQRGPAVKHGHAAAHVAEGERQVDGLVVRLDRAVAARQPDPVPIQCASAVIGDLARPRNMSAALEGVDAVIHSAGLTPGMSGIPEDDYRLMNTEATL